MQTSKVNVQETLKKARQLRVKTARFFLTEKSLKTIKNQGRVGKLHVMNER